MSQEAQTISSGEESKTISKSDNAQPTSRVQSPVIWDLLKILIPSLVTAAIGFLIWNAQTNIQTTVENSNRMLQTQLALKEEFYKRRLTIYENACKQIAETQSALDQAGATPEYETQAIAMVADLDKLRKANTLYWSAALDERLTKLWWLGIDKLKNRRFDDDASQEQLAHEIASLHEQMKQDLQLSEIARILQEIK